MHQLAHRPVQRAPTLIVLHRFVKLVQNPVRFVQMVRLLPAASVNWVVAFSIICTTTSSAFRRAQSATTVMPLRILQILFVLLVQQPLIFVFLALLTAAIHLHASIAALLHIFMETNATYNAQLLELFTMIMILGFASLATVHAQNVQGLAFHSVASALVFTLSTVLPVLCSVQTALLHSQTCVCSVQTGKTVVSYCY
jgi:hypothetical protein